ncbi:MAG: hypothetical protein ACLQKA_06315 [Bryobacteraceae bacterium]
MSSRLMLALTAFSAGMFAQAPRNRIIEKRDPALAVTFFTPQKTHVVRIRQLLVFTELRLTPIVAQSLDETDIVLNLRITTTSENGGFSFASVVVTADRKRVAVLDQVHWDASNIATIHDPNLIRLHERSKEAYITILTSELAQPFNRMSFRLSADQLADCRMMAEKYDTLLTIAIRNQRTAQTLPNWPHHGLVILSPAVPKCDPESVIGCLPLKWTS